ncbi:sensor histidine kinase [Paenibacillus sacheonensis]|uniref:ATP-binding protein n=1 Tax=Paenibacillus sacheonensis TaxID=742054 RepID=A0A7X4YUM0_9BACL|nr:sensor histidine kinase [Paenibacillus sacheonensis]MBM7568075.1 signal transduction histidine kinase [Paenibacillus sacheonensis]NBC72896.1 ATP-binding protein [Paenibacillus sacheonensis]
METYRIRPAGRHLITIGEGLIQDRYAAILELVKNSYDADSSDVIISFNVDEGRDNFTIIVEDHGHGMSIEEVIDKWMVPSTNDKVARRKSPNGRILQGRKGIGRYAANILGRKMKLETIQNSYKTTLFIDWDQFVNAKFLDEVELTIDNEVCSDKNGTKLTIVASKEDIDEWQKQIDILRSELKKLIPPGAPFLAKSEFKIMLVFNNFFLEQTKKHEEEIQPYPILDLYDYKITGKISADGTGKLIYENQKARNTLSEEVHFCLGQTNCGEIVVDIRVYDRDKDSIELLIARGLRDETTNKYLKNLETRQLLNSLNGIGVYRNGFRIRPLGDADFDWLKLNEQRVQNPSLKIGINQVIGYVHIESEEKSNLEERSARDGLKDNLAYNRLKEITCEIIASLEEKRFVYRRKAGLSKRTKVIEKELEKLFDYSHLQKSVSIALKKSGLNDLTISEINKMIEKEQIDKNAIIDDIKTTVAIYQGQATLGRIVNVILHEGRRPLNYFTNQISNLKFYTQKIKEDTSDSIFDKIIKITSGFHENASIFVNLFSRLDPLAAKTRATRSDYNLYQAIYTAAQVFENEFNIHSIEFSIKGSNIATWNGWKQDIYTIFTNLIDNSIFWMIHTKAQNKHIEISILEGENGDWYVDYEDSGPGIERDLLESGVIFEPEFTTKPNGTGSGLGLAIAGEAAQRNGLQLIALYNIQGVHFRLNKE